MDYTRLSDGEMEQARADAVARILADESPRKLVVAGPGTGKTFTFRELLQRSPGPNLAITFLTSLVRDLKEALGDLAAVYSFHGFAHRILRTTAVPGITLGVEYYPELDLIFESDLEILGTPATQQEIQDVLMNLSETDPALIALLRFGEYYDAVGYNDSVYRVLRHLRSNPAAIPKYAQIVVDEYQDFSRMETQLIDLLAAASPTLVVGDDDQALYTFRHASAIYLRELVTDDRYENFELPFCSRCTAVLVEATHHVVDKAQAQGLLQDRIPKPYVCYLPTKQESSDRHPKITHAHCSVENRRTPYIERYLEEQIRRIPHEDVERSREEGYPTVLVIGPKQFAKPAFDYLVERFPRATYKMSVRPELRAIDGYRLLMKSRNSRLGWRILLQVVRPRGWQILIQRALSEGAELVDLIDEGFRQEHVGMTELLSRVATNEELSPEEMSQAIKATGLSLADLLSALGFETSPDNPAEVSDEQARPESDDEPSILVTSLVGAKGLQASHVFIVGMNNGHFPRNNRAPTEDEVCQLLVALTRAQESCTIISVRNFGGTWLDASIFTDWLRPYLEGVDVNKAYFAS